MGIRLIQSKHCYCPSKVNKIASTATRPKIIRVKSGVELDIMGQLLKALC